MNRYVVSWSMPIAARTPRAAAKKAHGWIEDAIKNDNGANILVVRDADTEEHRGTFDEWGHGEEIKR